jgi:hypothetical protein
VTERERLQVQVWERRSTSYGGRYYFILRGRKILPIEKLGVLKQRGKGREPCVISASLKPDDLVLQVDFSNSGLAMLAYSCRAREMKPDDLGFHDTTSQDADPAILKRLSQNPALPKWLRNQLTKQAKRAES